MQINASYMIDSTFLNQYSEHGKEYLKSKAFKNYFHVNYHQVKYDRVYFYGILRTVTRSGGAGQKHVLRYQSTNDGFLTWRDMLEDCEHDGSIRVRIEKLKSIVTMPYTKKFSGGLIAFVDQFQTSIEELGTLLPMYSSEDNKLEFLTTALNKSRRETSYYLDYIRDHHLTFRQACAHIRERALMNNVFDDEDHNNKRFNKASQNVTPDKTPEDSFKQVYTIMQNWAEETGNDIHHVYATMNASQPLRESLMIPTNYGKNWHQQLRRPLPKHKRKSTQKTQTNLSHCLSSTRIQPMSTMSHKMINLYMMWTGMLTKLPVLPMFSSMVCCMKIHQVMSPHLMIMKIITLAWSTQELWFTIRFLLT